MAPAAKLVKAIYDAPLDPAPRRAYAAALKQGDPRRELIELQLGGGDALRERALITKHGKAWSGKLGTLFRHHVYRGGWFAGGTFKTTKKPSMRDPAWRLVQVVAKDWPPTAASTQILELINYPELVGLQGIYEIRPKDAVALATGPRRRFSELGMHSPGGDDDVEAIAKCPSLPNLTTLAIRLADDVAWLGTAPVLERIQRLIVDNGKSLPELVEICAKRRGALREIVISRDYLCPLFGAASWRFTLHRKTAPAPFTRVTGFFTPDKHAYFGYDLAPLSVLDPETVESIELVAPRVKIADDQRVHAAELLAPFKGVRVSWE